MFGLLAQAPPASPATTTPTAPAPPASPTADADADADAAHPAAHHRAHRRQGGEVGAAQGHHPADADRRQLEAELSTLAQEMKRLRARPELAAHLPDVEIFYRAVDGAFRYGEFFVEEDIAKAKQLLETGRARARALGSGKTPWLEIGRAASRWVTSRASTDRCSPTGSTVPEGYRAPRRPALAAGRLVPRAGRDAVAR